MVKHSHRRLKDAVLLYYKKDKKCQYRRKTTLEWFCCVKSNQVEIRPVIGGGAVYGLTRRSQDNMSHESYLKGKEYVVYELDQPNFAKNAHTEQ